MSELQKYLHTGDYLPAGDYVHKSTPFRHQAETFLSSRDLRGFAILWEQGTGKTKLGIDTGAWLFQQGKIDGVIVLAPSGVHRNWLTDELPIHCPDSVMARSLATYYTSSKAATKAHQRQMDRLLDHRGLSWLFMSYDAAVTPRGKQVLWDFLNSRKCLYMLDEAQNIKTPSTKRTSTIIKSGKYGHYRRILTGTPVSIGPFDLYSQLRFIDPGMWARRGMPKFLHFKRRYGVWLTQEECKRELGYDPGYDKLIEYKNIEELRETLAAVSSRVTKEDAGLDLPPKLYTKRYVELSKLQRDLYDELREKFLLEFEDGSLVDGQMALVRMLRLQQIVCGYVSTDAEEPIRMLEGPNRRLDTLVAECEGRSHQGIIWCRFKLDIQQIVEALGNKCVRYDGSLTEDEAQFNKEAFQRGDKQWFVGNSQKGATGLTLIQARTVDYYSNSFRLIDRLQSEDRAHRIGQKFPVTYTDYVVQDSIDERIVESMRMKFDIATQLTGDKLREWI